LILLGIALLFRILDIFILRLDERIGEIILSKALGFALVLAYVRWVGRRPDAVGLHGRNAKSAFAIGTGITVAAFILAVIAQIMTLEPGASLAIRAVDPKTGMAGGTGFAALLVVGNIVNSFMEEGLFRGIMLTHFLQRMRFGRANALQALLFSLWHLVWPAKALLSGEASAASAIAQGASLLTGTFVAGLVYGYLFWRTDSLWTPWIAHFLNNSTLNFVQVQGPAGDLQPAFVMSVAVVFALAFLTWAFSLRAGARKLPTLRPWNSAPQGP
jgi:membrane protease YdiL (CAAX protease family)